MNLYGRKHFPDISIEVDVDYAVNIKYDLMQDGRLISQQTKNSRSATFTTNPDKYAQERISISPTDGSGNSWASASVGKSIMNQIRSTARVQKIRESSYNITFNLAAFDTILGALEKRPHSGIQAQIMKSLLPCAKVAPHMFYDKLLPRLPMDVQMDYLFRMDEFITKDEEDDLTI